MRRRELDEISAAIGTVRFMDPPDGGDVSLAEQVRRMKAALDATEAKLAVAREALREARMAMADLGDGTCGRNCEAMYDADFYFEEEIAAITTALNTIGEDHG